MTDEESVATASDTVTSTSPAGSVSAPRWTAVAWILLGMLLGIIAIAAYARLIAAPPAAPLDAAGIRAAAREGTLDAIATVQAGGSPAESRAAGTPVVVKTAFAARPANQIGNQDAPVTIVEFSDFQ